MTAFQTAFFAFICDYIPAFLRPEDFCNNGNSGSNGGAAATAGGGGGKDGEGSEETGWGSLDYSDESVEPSVESWEIGSDDDSGESVEPIDQALIPYGLVSYDVGGNGDCQFLALAHHLDTTHKQVRAAVVDELRNNPNRYKHFAERWDVRGGEKRWKRDYNQFVTDMSQSEWGGNATLFAAANVYNRTLNIVSAPARDSNGIPYHVEVNPTPGMGHPTGKDVWLAHLDNNHYRATHMLDAYKEATLPSDAVSKTLGDLFKESREKATASDDSYTGEDVDSSEEDQGTNEEDEEVDEDAFEYMSKTLEDLFTASDDSYTGEDVHSYEEDQGTNEEDEEVDEDL
jgi:hypothetical protein